MEWPGGRSTRRCFCCRMAATRASPSRPLTASATRSSVPLRSSSGQTMPSRGRRLLGSPCLALPQPPTTRARLRARAARLSAYCPRRCCPPPTAAGSASPTPSPLPPPPPPPPISSTPPSRRRFSPPTADGCAGVSCEGCSGRGHSPAAPAPLDLRTEGPPPRRRTERRHATPSRLCTAPATAGRSHHAREAMEGSADTEASSGRRCTALSLPIPSSRAWSSRTFCGRPTITTAAGEAVLAACRLRPA
mmetsp:Transcript_2177/g.6705  ORF Transcript_2177/g.6705 Transcript_2177/m.6705 type:complete len:248 (+) Transcript_2177:345-1088(+)